MESQGATGKGNFNTRNMKFELDTDKPQEVAQAQPIRYGKLDLRCMDNMELMAQFPDKHFELAIVDPPYGIKRDSGFDGFGGFGAPIARKVYKGNWDSETPSVEYFNELLRVSKNQIIWGGNFFTDKIPQANHWVFWDKKNTMPTFGDGELAWTSFQRNSVKQIDVEYNGLIGKEKNRIHATQKPVLLYKKILANYAKQGDKILDTHLGSGSIAIACHYLGYDLTGCELDADYFQAMQDRIKRETQQLTLL